MDRLRDSGLRVTPQRLAVYQALAASPVHPTAQAIFEQLQGDLPSLSQATVYNTLQAMVEIGLVREIAITSEDGAVRFDANVSPHAHVVCERCKRVDDYFAPMPDLLDYPVEQDTGYEIHFTGVSFYGLCPTCRQTKAKVGL
jgi:Fur family peroxide stress response transcriptional regulator